MFQNWNFLSLSVLEWFPESNRLHFCLKKPTFLNCDNRVTAAERQKMQQRVNWWNSNDAKEQLKNAAIGQKDVS